GRIFTMGGQRTLRRCCEAITRLKNWADHLSLPAREPISSSSSSHDEDLSDYPTQGSDFTARHCFGKGDDSSRPDLSAAFQNRYIQCISVPLTRHRVCLSC